MATHPVLWKAPSPLWGRFAPPITGTSLVPDEQARPAILRFASDEFMDQLLAMLAADPRQLGEVIARPETWRSPGGETPDLVERVPLPPIARMLVRARKDKAPASEVARTEAERTTTENDVISTVTLKLFHPAHQRHYLVAANLVCAVGGLPDRTASPDQLGFLLRRLLPSQNGTSTPVPEEYAFVKDAGGSRWQRVAADSGAPDPAARLVPGEEMLPLFPINFRDAIGQDRRLLAGVVPVGRREEYMSSHAHREAPRANGNGASPAGAGGIPAPPTPKSERKEQFKLEVSEPWKNLVRSAYKTAARIVEPGSSTVTDRLAERHNQATFANEQLQAQSWLVLLDFADYLALHLPRVWACVESRANEATLNTQERNLFNWLKAAAIDLGSAWRRTTPVPNLRQALSKVRSARGGLEGAEHAFPNAPGSGLQWPDFYYLLAGVRETRIGSLSYTFVPTGPHLSLQPVGVAGDSRDADPTEPPLDNADSAAALLDKLVQLVLIAINDAEVPAKAAPPLPFAAGLRDALASTNGDPGWFVLRCAYTRWECGPLQPPVLSPPSQQFQLASFFDPDAPARPIRIALPLDTTPAGLRKFNKNTAFMISDVLCGQIQRAKGLGFGDLVLSVLPWPFHKDLDIGSQGIGPCKSNATNIGMICSLSIPIITICALILLMMIVLILDLIFRWIPWFIICFPIPGLKGKK